MSDREREAIDLLRRIYEGEAGHPLMDDGMVVEWIDNEIATFIRKHGAFDELLREREDQG
jgi:hypothetical protein